MNDDLIQPTEAEARNGWTVEALTDYVRQQSDRQRGIIYFDPAHRKPPRPNAANSKYNPRRCWG